MVENFKEIAHDLRLALERERERLMEKVEEQKAYQRLMECFDQLISKNEELQETLDQQKSENDALHEQLQQEKAKSEEGADADLCVWDLEKEYTIDPDSFQTKGRATPFEGMQVFITCCELSVPARGMICVDGGRLTCTEE